MSFSMAPPMPQPSSGAKVKDKIIINVKRNTFVKSWAINTVE